MSFIILIILLLVVFWPVAFVYALLQMLGFSSFAIWLSPAAVIFISLGLTAVGLLLVIGDLYQTRFFYPLGIWYLKGDIHLITVTVCEK